MSIKGVGLVPLLLINNMNAVLKKRTKFFAKKNVLRWRSVSLALLQRGDNEKVESFLILRTAIKTTKARRDYNNHIDELLNFNNRIFEQNFDSMSNQESLQLFRSKKCDITRLVKVV